MLRMAAIVLSLCNAHSLVQASDALTFKVLSGEDPECIELASELTDKVSVDSFTAPKIHHSGSPLSFELVLAKKLKFDRETWLHEYSSVNLNSIIEKPYTKFIHHSPETSMIDFFFEDGVSRAFKVETDVAGHIGGMATHRLSFTFLKPDSTWCNVGAVLGSQLDIQSKNIDITPPLVRSIKYDKLSYRAGETVTVTFEFSEPLKSPESDHIQFTNRNLVHGQKGRSIPEYDSNTIHKLNPISERAYTFSFKVPDQTQQGSYHPDYFNRFDELNNFEDAIGHEDRFEKQIVATSPLVVRSEDFARVDQDLQSYLASIKAKQDEFNRLPINRQSKEWVKSELSYMFDVDQYTREYLNHPKQETYSESETKYFWAVFVPIWLNLDFCNTEELKRLVGVWDWFSVSTFGVQADHQAWLIVQHADHDVEFQKIILNKLEKLYPTGETSPKNYAYLYDRVAASWQNSEARKPQRYGTQGQCVEAGKWQPLPIENPDHLDERRKEVGLGPLQDYIAQISQQCH